ncbi:MFS transporter [Paludibacterium paludis]|uniref:MFS transporter n=1 Tax=Paludibacterium paludis TaxID=1225769 RepID=A0A918UC33_9NEIS|nr:MFS transporter [Paludibacterium paludis]GGY27445.1 MFS transporter [Paludibacterium paludis]
MSASHRHPGRATGVLLAGIILIGINLRPALSSLAPVLADVCRDTGLDSLSAGLLTTLPVLCLGLAGPLAPRLAARFGGERVILATLLSLAAGIVLRSLLGPAGLYAGTLIAGASIGVIGVLLPGIVKHAFPNRASLMTGVYTLALCLGAALAAGATVPLANIAGGDWRPALMFWAVPALLAALAWWPSTRRAAPPADTVTATGSLLRDPLAWQVTLYLGLQSSLAYIVFGWLPSILTDRGLAPVDAGFAMSLSVMSQMVTALAAPALAHLRRDQCAAIALMVLLTLAGFMGVLEGDIGSLWLWGVVLGLGQGGAFGLALSLIVLRSPTPHAAARLSGMAQGIGYLMAAAGPLAAGLLHRQTGSWHSLGILIGVVSLADLAFGLLAGRNRQVRTGA